MYKTNNSQRYISLLCILAPCASASSRPPRTYSLLLLFKLSGQAIIFVFEKSLLLLVFVLRKCHWRNETFFPSSISWEQAWLVIKVVCLKKLDLKALLHCTDKEKCFSNQLLPVIFEISCFNILGNNYQLSATHLLVCVQLFRNVLHASALHHICQDFHEKLSEDSLLLHHMLFLLSLYISFCCTFQIHASI